MRDQGKGIRQSDIKNLILDYDKLSADDRFGYSGSNLSLTICKQLIEQTGGSIQVKSKINTGTDFIINLKLRGKHESVNVVPANNQSCYEPVIEDLRALGQNNVSKVEMLKFIEVTPDG